jgi:hypothetical protein
VAARGGAFPRNRAEALILIRILAIPAARHVGRARSGPHVRVAWSHVRCDTAKVLRSTGAPGHVVSCVQFTAAIFHLHGQKTHAMRREV